LAGRPPRPTSHHTTPSPTTLPEDLLLSRFVLVRRDAVQPPPRPPTAPPDRAARLRRSTARPARYTA
jgi:hypothetical protein